MRETEYLIVGAGVTGLATANWLLEYGVSPDDILVVEREEEAGGYCRTVRQDGFVWDYSGHFFHFRDPEIERWMLAKMPEARIAEVEKRALIRYGGRDIDFPFQQNIHQLEKSELVECLHDLYFRQSGDAASFKQMLYQRFGRAICEKFLIPYNEKLYACDLDDLDADAMGRFFPSADADKIFRNIHNPDNTSYNSRFIYPEQGAAAFIAGLLAATGERVHLSQAVNSIEVDKRVAHVGDDPIRYRHLISSAPLPLLLQICGMPSEPSLSANRVLVFNLGFAGKGRDDVHWMYFPDKSLPFYRVGWYDNILSTDRMSLYVEVGMEPEGAVDVESHFRAVMDGLKREGIADSEPISRHSVVLDPAYVHISGESIQRTGEIRRQLSGAGVHSVGRYGRWTYCSIEDNVIEARALVAELTAGS